MFGTTRNACWDAPRHPPSFLHSFFLKLFFFLWIMPVIYVLEVHTKIHTSYESMNNQQKSWERHTEQFRNRTEKFKNQQKTSVMKNYEAKHMLRIYLSPWCYILSGAFFTSSILHSLLFPKKYIIRYMWNVGCNFFLF